MGNYNNSSAALAAGKKGEDIATDCLERLGFTIDDVSGDKEYQQKDIGFLSHVIFYY